MGRVRKCFRENKDDRTQPCDKSLQIKEESHVIGRGGVLQRGSDDETL